MPTVLRAGPYRFLFYSSDAEEPPHVHVERDDNSAIDCCISNAMLRAKREADPIG